MSFLNVLFLAGIAGVAGPLLAHLLARPRYKRIPFTMMQFLEAGQLESHRKRRFRNLFLLLLRCAIIACIALGFAGPIIEKVAEASGDQETLIIGFDDSLSMTYGNRFDELRTRLKTEIGQWPENTLVDLIGLSSGARIQRAAPTVAAAFLDDLEPVVDPARVDGLAAALQALGDASGVATVLLVGDFTPRFLKEMESVPVPIPVAQATAILPEAADRIDNLTINEVRTTMAGKGQLQATISLRNQDSESRATTVEARIGDSIVASESAEINPGRTHSVVLNIKDLDQYGTGLPLTFSLQGADGLAADDHYYVGVSFPESTEKHVLILCRDGREGFLARTALESLGAEMPHVRLTVQVMPFDTLNPSSLQIANVVVLTSVAPPVKEIGDALLDYVRGGGSLLTFVHRDQDPETLSALFETGLLPALPEKLQQESSTLVSNTGHQGGEGSPDALRALENYRFGNFVFDAWYTCQAGPDTRTQWILDNGEALLYRCRLGAGESILMNTSADDSLSDLSKSPATLPLYSYLLGSGGSLQSAAFAADEALNHSFTLLTTEALPEILPVPIKTPDGALVSGQYQEGTLRIPAVHELGFAVAQLEPPIYVGLNVPEGETDLSVPDAGRVEQAMKSLFVEKGDAATGTPGMPDSDEKHFGAWALTAALALLLFETFVANRMVR